MNGSAERVVICPTKGNRRGRQWTDARSLIFGQEICFSVMVDCSLKRHIETAAGFLANCSSVARDVGHLSIESPSTMNTFEARVSICPTTGNWLWRAVE
jgi:hypothetical protein